MLEKLEQEAQSVEASNPTLAEKYRNLAKAMVPHIDSLIEEAPQPETTESCGCCQLIGDINKYGCWWCW